MSSLLVFFTLLAYAGAFALLWRERSLCYLLILVAGHLAMLLTPLWQRVFEITTTAGTGLSLPGGFDVPWSLFIGGGVLLSLPVLVIYFGLRHGWWPRHYAAIWLTYAVFVFYFLLLETLLDRNGGSLFSDRLLVADTILAPKFVESVFIAGVALGMLYTMVSTRHYALEVSLVPLLLSGVASSLLFLGIFASPLWVAGLLEQSGLIMTSAALVSFGLVIWGVHLLASGLHTNRRQHLIWR